MKKVIFSAVTLLLVSTACKKEETKPTSNPLEAAKKSAISTYANIVYASYEDSYNDTKELSSKINQFVANPTELKFQEVKKSWIKARESYGQTEVYRFGDGPIDDADGPEGLLNAWPLDEVYIDYISTNPNSGIINDVSITINEATLEAKNEEGGEANVSVGYHAIEFLLWGQDDVNTALLTPGNRPYTDFVDGGTASNQGRRRDYLKVCGKLLVKHLKLLVDEWKDNGNYRKSFIQLPVNQAISKIFSGMGILAKSELAGERIFVALNNSDQEDEHSCFSDNTHRDIILNAQGIYNVYNGIYRRTSGIVVSGTSFASVVKMKNSSLNSELETLMNNSLKETNNIPIPFDNALKQETAGGNGPIMKAIKTLQIEGDKIAEAAAALGVTISTDLPE